MKTLLAGQPFRRLLAAWSVGNFADSALYLTLAIWVKDLTGSSAAAGMVFFCLGLPMLAAPLFGLLADRVRRRPLLIAANLIAAACVVTLITVRTSADVPILYAVTMAYGALGTLNSSAQSGLLRTMLPDEQLGPANALFATIDQGLRIVTPVVGAGLYALWGGVPLALGTAALLAIAAAGLTLVRVDEPRPVRRRRMRGVVRESGAPADGTSDGGIPDDSGLAALVAGFRHIWRTAVLRDIVIGLAIALSVVGVFDSLLFAVIEHGLGRPPEFFGVLLSAQGAGSILGGLTAVRLMKAVGAGRTVVLGLALLAAGTIPLVSGQVGLVIAGMVLGGIAIPWAFVAMATTRQLLTPNALQGRATSATTMALQIPQLISTGLGAALVSLVDFRVMTLVAAAVIAAGALWLFRASGAHAPAAASTAAP